MAVIVELDDKALAKEDSCDRKVTRPYRGKLETDERVLARITEGIYRQPASALRELVSNAYDADATEVVILTDAPRFGQITVRDNGRGCDLRCSPTVKLHRRKSEAERKRGKTWGNFQHEQQC